MPWHNGHWNLTCLALDIETEKGSIKLEASLAETETTKAELAVATMTQGFWRAYKTKVMQALGGELQEEDLQDEVEQSMIKPILFPWSWNMGFVSFPTHSRWMDVHS